MMKQYKNNHKNNRKKSGKCAAFFSALLSMVLLASCAARESQPTVTQDDLTQLSTVQNVLEQDAGNGKNYAYYWDAEDIDAAMARRNERVQAYLAVVDEWLAGAENMTPEELAEAGYDSIEQARERCEEVKANELENLESAREYLEKEAALDPVVSAQEAANRAGVIFEEVYGVDLSQDILELDCRESGPDNILHPERVGALRPIWVVSREEAADGVLFSTNSFYCTMDGTTGEILYIEYTPSMQELEERKALPYPACFAETGDGGTGFGRWNAEDASFAPMIEAAAQNIKQLLSGSALFGGAQVTDVRGEVTEYDDGDNELWLYLSCDDGKSYRLRVNMPYDPLCTDGTGTPYPMRGLRMWIDT